MKGFIRVIKPRASAPSVALSKPPTSFVVAPKPKKSAKRKWQFEEEKYTEAALNQKLIEAIESEREHETDEETKLATA